MRHWEFESDGRRERPQDKEKENDFDDPDVKDVARYARHHYPGSKSLQGAFYKFVQRSLLHSLESDRRQDKEINQLKQDIESLKSKSTKAIAPDSPVPTSNPEPTKK